MAPSSRRRATLAWLLLRPGLCAAAASGLAVAAAQAAEEAEAKGNASLGALAKESSCPCAQAAEPAEIVQLRAEVAMLTEATRSFDSDSLAVQLADTRASLTVIERDARRLEGELELAQRSSGAAPVCLEGNYLPGSKQEGGCEGALRIAEENATRLALESARREERRAAEAAQAETLRGELAAAKAALGEAEATAEQLHERTSFQEELLAKRAAEAGALTRELAAARASLRLAEGAANRSSVAQVPEAAEPAVEPAAAAADAAAAEAAEALRVAREEAEGLRAEAARLEERLAAKALEATRLEQKLAASSAEAGSLQRRLAAAKAVRVEQSNATSIEDSFDFGATAPKLLAPESCKGLAAELADARAALRVAEGPALTGSEAAPGCDCEAMARELADARAALEVTEAFPPAQRAPGATEWEHIVRGAFTQVQVLYLEVRAGKFGDPGLIALGCALVLVLLCCCCGGLLLDSGGF